MEADGLAAAARRAEAWAGEPFLRPDEDPAEALSEGRARRRALDDALEEMEAGRRTPSPSWKIRYALMLGLERELTDHPPRLASGTELRRHQVDALAGMLTELIAANQRADEEPMNGNGQVEALDVEDEDEDFGVVDEEPLAEELSPEQDPGAVRRYRFRHPTASGKTIAAAGFVDAAKKQGTAVLVVTHEPRVAGFADRTVLMRDGVDSVQVNGVETRLPTGGDSLRVGAGEPEPSADTISGGSGLRPDCETTTNKASLKSGGRR